MNFVDLIKETFLALSSNKSRSALTVLGIVIGIASVISMISVGQGASKSIQTNIESLGSNLLVVTPGFQRQAGNVVRTGFGEGSTLIIEDSDAISKEVENISAVAPIVSSRKQAKTTKGTNTNTSINGISGAYQTVKNIEIDTGAFIDDSQVAKIARVAVLGPTTRDDLFGEETDAIGQKIRISNLEFTVIGVTKSKGGTGFSNSDDLIYIPISTYQALISGNKSVSSINIQVSEKNLMTQAQQDITGLVLSLHKISDPLQADFTVVNQTEVINAVSSVAGTMTLLLGSIAGISLLVGGIGIMNMMLTAVSERTREIGLRKSLGAKNKDINRQFLSESIALTFTGGVIGIILGWLISFLISKFANMATFVNFNSVLLAFGVSALIGIVFGYYPAKRAAKLNPIEALRYE